MMNAPSSSPSDIGAENNGGSDSDNNSYEELPDYYQPISGVDEEEEEDNSGPVNREDHHHGPSNGYCTLRQAEERISTVSLNGGVEQKSESEDEDEEGREMEREAINRAFREDERRRRSPLTEENAARVMEAMQAISFRGVAPDWVSQVPEDRWLDHLRRLRQPS